jgi:tol-pal system protein YbgF
MIISALKRALITAMLLSIAVTTAYAEDAPVYDVDNFPPQFDGQPERAPQSPTPSTSTQGSQPQQLKQLEEEDGVSSMPSSSNLSSDERIARLEQQILNLQHANSAAKLNAVQTEVQALRGKVEDLTHQLQQIQSQQRSMYSDLDKRLNKQSIVNPEQVRPTQPAEEDKPVVPKVTLKKPVKVSVTKTKTTVSATTDDALLPAKHDTSAETSPSLNSEQQELEMYQSAYDLIKDSKFDQAIGVLQTMLKKYPSGQSAANAHYWLGELFGLQKKKEQAATEFATVVKNYPDSPKVSDAQVKLGMIYAAQFKWADAKTTFKKVISGYPGSTSARLASQQLKEIKAGGH